MKIAVIIVTYNGMKWIEECFNNLLKSSIPVTLIVVDNSSNDGTIDYIKKNYKEIILFQQKKNVGFGQANNIGISYSINEKADYIFLLNQDAFVEKDTIKNLVNTAFHNPQFGIISPIQLDYSGKLLENYFFKFMAKDLSRTFYSDFVLKNELKEIYNVDFVQAASWLIPATTIKKIGGFDPIFFHYGEDDNYCQRVLFHDLKIGVVSNAYIRHDSTIHDTEIIARFSEKFYAKYKKDLGVLYANINKPFDTSGILKERKKIYLQILFNLFKLNFNKVKGFKKKLSIFKLTINQIEISRKKNQMVNTHYLDV